ncbi:MAG: hypothetical protein ACRYG4_02855 [Janthinobacterium lividum]
MSEPRTLDTMAPALMAARYPVLKPYLYDAGGSGDSPETATGRSLVLTGWERLLRGAVECIDVHLRNGWIIPDIIEVRVRGPMAEASTLFGSWNHAFALDEVALVRCIDFGRFRD